MEIRHLRYFCSVAEHKSFSRASVRLRVAQPSLSRQVRDLEKDLGVTLFVRSSSGVQLTDAGEAFYQYSTKILGQLAIAVSAVQEIGKGNGGEFIIGGDWRLPLDVIPRAVMELRKRFPKVDVHLCEIPMHEQMMALRDRKIHMGFVPDFYMGMGEGMESRQILRTDIVAVLPENHRLANKELLKLEDLQNETWLTVDEKNAPGIKSYYQQLFRLAQMSPKFAPSSASMQGVVTRIVAGDGITLLPHSLFPTSHRGVALVRMELEPFELYAIWPREGASPLVAPFIDLISIGLQG